MDTKVTPTMEPQNSRDRRGAVVYSVKKFNHKKSCSKQGGYSLKIFPISVSPNNIFFLSHGFYQSQSKQKKNEK